MALILSGTDGLSDVDGSAGTPAIRGTDTNTGIFFPAADTIAFSEGGVESMRLDSSGNLGIGTSSPSGASGRVLEVNGGSGQARFVLKNDTTGSASTDGSQIALVGAQLVVQNREASDITFETNNSERARITSGGNLLVGTTTSGANAGGLSLYNNAGAGRIDFSNTTGANTNTCVFYYGATPSVSGSIQTASTSVSYNTSSDYRLKEAVQPMTGALAKVAALKPCTYKWKVDGSDGQGFIAHELAEVVPQCVTGEKDAVDADGKPVYQGIDTSFLVATLTAAIQEQQAIIQSLTARIEALEGKA